METTDYESYHIERRIKHGKKVRMMWRNCRKTEIDGEAWLLADALHKAETS
jgi:hypothetical protein